MIILPKVVLVMNPFLSDIGKFQMLCISLCEMLNSA